MDTPFHAPLPSLALYLAGSWRIRRRVWDRRAGVTGRLDGAAQFQAAAAGLRYDESGEMQFGAHRGPASQNYLYRPLDGAQAEVFHGDGRPFHLVDLRTGIAPVWHQCGADIYRGRYRVLSEDCWWLAWRVTGPRKDYLMATRYLRAAYNSIN